MPSKDCKCAIHLFAYDHPGELVGQGHGSHGEKQGGTLAIGVGPAVGGADGEDDALLALVAHAAEPAGKFL